MYHKKHTKKTSSYNKEKNFWQQQQPNNSSPTTAASLRQLLEWSVRLSLLKMSTNEMKWTVVWCQVDASMCCNKNHNWWEAAPALNVQMFVHQDKNHKLSLRKGTNIINKRKLRISKHKFHGKQLRIWPQADIQDLATACEAQFDDDGQPQLLAFIKFWAKLGGDSKWGPDSQVSALRSVVCGIKTACGHGFSVLRLGRQGQGWQCLHAICKADIVAPLTPPSYANNVAWSNV